MKARAVLGLSVVSIIALATGCAADPRDAGGSGGTDDSDASASMTTAPADSSVSDGETSAGATTDDTNGEGPPPPKYDLGIVPDAPDYTCEAKGGAGPTMPQLSYIWISNSQQGTISKIDTQSVEEQGRYYAKQAGGDPSRTSVNLNGDVAVANRNGGVAKFWANPAHCQDSNGTPGIQTSEGAGDILPFGDDDCLAWYTPFSCGSQRPMAWTRGTWNEGVCGYVDAKLWTVCDSEVHLLDGETGEVEESIPIPGSYVFVYGGAADANGTFWGLNTYGSPSNLIRVDGETHELTTHTGPPSGGYGITVDPEGRPWLCGGGGVSRFNLDDSSWDTAGTTGGIGGCMTDGADLIWHSNPSGLLLGYNIDTLEVDEQVQLPEYVHGISVDFYGHVWGVGFANNNAYRADPSDDDVVTYSGLTGAYTYSDMTGHNLSTAGGGGVPQG
jgi:hypothetical protein